MGKMLCMYMICKEIITSMPICIFKALKELILIYRVGDPDSKKSVD